MSFRQRRKRVIWSHRGRGALRNARCFFLLRAPLHLPQAALGFNTQADLTRFFLEEAKVAMNPGESFGPGGKNHMRLNTACPRSILEEALSRIEVAAAKRMAELAAK